MCLVVTTHAMVQEVTIAHRSYILGAKLFQVLSPERKPVLRPAFYSSHKYSRTTWPQSYRVTVSATETSWGYCVESQVLLQDIDFTIEAESTDRSGVPQCSEVYQVHTQALLAMHAVALPLQRIPNMTSRCVLYPVLISVDSLLAVCAKSKEIEINTRSLQLVPPKEFENLWPGFFHRLPSMEESWERIQKGCEAHMRETEFTDAS